MVKKEFRKIRPKRSLRTILMVWFLLLSLVPLMFVTGYSKATYEKALDNEVNQRLQANSREFTNTMGEYEKFLNNRRNRLKADPFLSTALLTSSIAQIRERVQSLVRSSPVSETFNVFNSEGERIVSYSKDDSGALRQNEDQQNIVMLSDPIVEILKGKGQYTYIYAGTNGNIELIACTKIEGKNGRRVGFVEEVITVGQGFLQNLKKQLGLEVVLFNDQGLIVASSQPDFELYEKNTFSKVVLGDSESFFDLPIRDEPFRFISSQVKWGDSKFVVALGASKQKSRAFIKSVNYAFFTMIFAIGILLVLISIVATRSIVQPVYELVEASRNLDNRDGPAEISISTSTELGVLQESFNEMSRRIFEAKTDLEKKIRELESAYTELKETQTRLVHTAKMAGLGQLVAGIAHELNNPIGFIYSNMSHLRDYSDRLIHLVRVAESDPGRLSAAKAEADFDYIVSDLPRLIASCEEGARRTRDIVLGLRNFSRLDEAKLKRVKIGESIENTLRLIAGEIKNRVEVHLDLSPVPEVLCFASQLNQVFMNILANAAQAIEGEGDIWISLKHLNYEKRVLISIKDNGKGMSPEILEKIFDPFFTTKGIGQGTGLGLSISYGIIRQHGGDIQVKSEPGKGTEFIIRLPIDGEGMVGQQER